MIVDVYVDFKGLIQRKLYVLINVPNMLHLSK